MQGSSHLTRVYKSMVAQTLAQDRRIRLARLKGYPCPSRKDIFPHWKHSKVFFPPSERHHLEAVRFWKSQEATGPGTLSAKMKRYASRTGALNRANNKDWETRVLMLEDNYGRVSVEAMAPRLSPVIAPRPPMVIPPACAYCATQEALVIIRCESCYIPLYCSTRCKKSDKDHIEGCKKAGHQPEGDPTPVVDTADTCDGTPYRMSLDLVSSLIPPRVPHITLDSTVVFKQVMAGVSPLPPPPVVTGSPRQAPDPLAPDSLVSQGEGSAQKPTAPIGPVSPWIEWTVSVPRRIRTKASNLVPWLRQQGGNWLDLLSLRPRRNISIGAMVWITKHALHSFLDDDWHVSTPCSYQQMSNQGYWVEIALALRKESHILLPVCSSAHWLLIHIDPLGVVEIRNSRGRLRSDRIISMVRERLASSLLGSGLESLGWEYVEGHTVQQSAEQDSDSGCFLILNILLLAAKWRGSLPDFQRLPFVVGPWPHVMRSHLMGLAFMHRGGNPPVPHRDVHN